MGGFMSSAGKSLPTAQMLGLVTGTLHRQFVEKDIQDFDEFHMAILDIFSTVNAALPGKHYDVPPLKEVEACFRKWQIVDDSEKKTLFMEFLKWNLNLSKLDDPSIIVGIITPPVAMATKRTIERVPQLKVMKSIPDVLYVPLTTVLALVYAKMARKMFLGRLAS